MDVTLRLEQIVLDIERTREPILIVGKSNLTSSCSIKYFQLSLIVANYRSLI